jgi:hypothetical protein
MVNHQDQSSLEIEILGIGIMIEGQKTETDTGATNHLRDLEVRGIETMTDMFIGEERSERHKYDAEPDDIDRKQSRYDKDSERREKRR